MLDALLDRCALTDDRPPLVGVSACLLGRPVRYNGEHRQEALVADLLSQRVRLREFCPEVGIGLPVPRPPIQVVETISGRRVRGVADPSHDYTDALGAYADAVPDELDGFVLKARSPSCGLGNTPLMDEQDRQIGLTSGEFARTLTSRFPLMPILDESALRDARAVDAFALRAWLYRSWRMAPAAGRVREWLGVLSETPLAGAVHPWLMRLETA